MTTAWLLDFDGTVSPTDVGAALIDRFARGDQVAAAEALARWKQGTLGHRSLTEQECGRMVATREQALAFARGFEVDPAFAGFARAARAHGDPVEVVSEGFDFYIAELLARAGLPDLPVAANRVHIEGHTWVPEFPHYDAGCARCGNCKGRHVRRHQARGHRVVFVGDGLSDRCGAAAADRVFAKGALLDWCRGERIAAEPFTGFAGLSAALAA